MRITTDELTALIDSVGCAARDRKKLLLDAHKKSNSDEDISNTLKWFRSRKNADLKDKLTLEGVSRGFSVRAEKTMGARSEYCSRKEQESFKRFDLSWEKKQGSKDYILIVEIEMDLDSESIMKDFRKLKNNTDNCIKVMLCQAKTEQDSRIIDGKVKKELKSGRNQGGCTNFCVNGICSQARHPVFKLDTKAI